MLTGSTLDVDTGIVLLRRPPPGHRWHAPYAQRGGLLISTSWSTPASVRAAFRDPGCFSTYVPGWREAVILDDPTGLAARLQTEARGVDLGRRADAAMSGSRRHMTGWAEEVHKLVGALDAGDALLAATQRSLLAVHLAGVVAMRRRILFGTDNVMWDLVAEAMGEPWASAQAAALSLGGEGWEASSRAALRLYALAAEEGWGLLDRRQRAVVGHACAIAGWPRGG